MRQSLPKNRQNKSASRKQIDENSNGHSGYRRNDGGLARFPAPPVSNLTFKEHQKHPENNQDDTDGMVDPCHRLRAAEPADMMGYITFQQIRG